MSKKRWLLLGIAALTIGLCGCKAETVREAVAEDTETKSLEALKKEAKQNTFNEEYKLQDNDALYEQDDDYEVVTMYLTVRQGNAEENTNHTWNEVNSHSVYDYERLGIERDKVEGILQVGDENGPYPGEFGYDETVPNTIVNIRGQSSSQANLKSYKIRIKDDKGTYKGQKTLNLNKHAYDETKFRNKLCYDLMEELPDMVSLRTQFVHLYVKDETENQKNAQFEDYGLYTHVEQPNKKFLKNHGFDRYGQLYKLNEFEFYRYEDEIRLSSDAKYNADAFNKRLEAKGSEDHSKLIKMLDELNDYSIPIEDFFEKWFDEDNFFSWMAFHILMGNNDTQSRNLFLYSPLNMNRWYFISWDNDACLSITSDRIETGKYDPGWMYGVSNYWGNVLFQRVLRSPKYREKLDEKIEEYHSFLNEEMLAKRIEKYANVVWPYRNKLPDILTTKVTNDDFLKICEAMPKEVEQNYKAYKKSMNCPMPFYIGAPFRKNGVNVMSWDVAYDFDNEDITYEVLVGRDYTFQNPIIHKENQIIPEIEFGNLEPGQYFIKVIAKNESGYEQMAFDYYRGENGKVYGTKCFYVLEDGTMREDTYEEE